MTNTRKLSTGVTAALAAGALLTGAAFAESDAMLANDADTDGGGSAIAKLARATTLTGEAKGDAISAAAKAADSEADLDVDNDEDNDVDDTSASTTDRDAHGDAVSMLARTTTLTGEAKGDAISALASSKSHRTSH
jgi:hypothetical protein